MSSFIMPNLEEAESRLDSLFAGCGFASDHPAMQDWVAIKFALQSARQNAMESPGTDKQQAKVKITRCPYDGDCDVSTKIDSVIYCERASGVCNG